MPKHGCPICNQQQVEKTLHSSILCELANVAFTIVLGTLVLVTYSIIWYLDKKAKE